MTRPFLTLLCLLALTGCTGHQQEVTVLKQEPSGAPRKVAPVRPLASDAGISKALRQSLFSDQAMSVNAHNIHIATEGGVVHLRGAVDDEQEKIRVGEKAVTIPGVRSVDNRLHPLTKGLAGAGELR